MKYEPKNSSGRPAPSEKPQPPLPIEITDWRPLIKNSLRGFISVKLGKNLLFHDMPVMASNGRRWVAMPSKPRLNRDGTPVISQNGKALYTPIVSWADRESGDRFSRTVINVLLEFHPDALGDGGFDDGY